MDDSLTIALVSDVFHGRDGEARLRERLVEAKARGARLAVLPELPLDPWIPATRQVREEDAEPPGGPRHAVLSRAAAAGGIGLLGGAIVREPASGRRFNTALLFDERGDLVHTYRKLHLPQEEGFWETRHYEPGDDPPSVAGAFGMPLGIQICSDVNRPEGSHILGALGAEAILCPRAAEAATWPRWRLVLQANAITSTAHVVCVNRPRPENDIPLGGPSVAILPNGEVVLESADPVSVVTLDRAQVRRARQEYPGYLPVRADVYASSWARVAADIT